MRKKGFCILVFLTACGLCGCLNGRNAGERTKTMGAEVEIETDVFAVKNEAETGETRENSAQFGPSEETEQSPSEKTLPVEAEQSPSEKALPAEAEQSPSEEALPAETEQPPSEKTEQPEETGQPGSEESLAEETQTISPAEMTETADLSDYFGEIRGCAVWYSPAENRYVFYNEEMCRQEVSPYSTFKIVSALSGLKNGVLEDADSVMRYSGTVYPVPEWNRDLTLKEAVQSSCIWYFRQVIDAVGRETLEKELTLLEYGNCDLSDWEGSGINPLPELNGFWLGSSLKISPLEQTQVLKRIFEGESIYGEEETAVLKELLRVSDDGGRQIYGKTGSGSGEAWFVGFCEENGGRAYFAVYLNDSTQSGAMTGAAAKEIAMEWLTADRTGA